MSSTETTESKESAAAAKAARERQEALDKQEAEAQELFAAVDAERAWGSEQERLVKLGVPPEEPKERKKLGLEQAVKIYLHVVDGGQSSTLRQQDALQAVRDAVGG